MEQFADIEGPVRIGFLWVIALSVAAILLLALAGFLVRYLILRSRQESKSPAEPQRSPLEIAIERIELLKSGNTSLSAEPFTVEVADIVRDYLEATLDVPAREQTSEEFLQAVQTRDTLPAVLQQYMPAFLEQCDRVKFARQSLAGDQRDKLLVTASTVVRETDGLLNPQLDPEPSHSRK